MFNTFETQASQPFVMGSSGRQMTDAKQPRQEEKSSVLPVTIRSIEKALAKTTDSEVSFFGTEPATLLLVAVVESVSQEGLHVEFMLNDSTGRIKVRHYAVDAESMLKCVEVGRYLQVAGQLRTSPEAHISVQNARVARSADDISYHMIESAHAALRLTKGKVEPSTPMPKSKTAPQAVEVTPPKEVTPAAAVNFSSPVSGYSAPSAAVVYAAPPMPEKKAAEGPLEGDALKAAAKVALKPYADTEEGVSVKVLSAQLKCPEASLRTALVQLMDEGDVFNTLDDEHFNIL